MPGGERTDYRSLGEILRQAREEQGLDRDELAERTKIHPRMIAALEADDLDQLSGPVYARSFVRTLASTLNLDEQWLLTKLENASAAMGSQSRPRAPLPPASPPKTVVAPGPARPAEDEQTWKIDSVRVRRVGAPRSTRVPWRRLGMAAGVLGFLALVVWGIGDRLRNFDDSTPPMPTLVGELEPAPVGDLTDGRPLSPPVDTGETFAGGDSSGLGVDALAEEERANERPALLDSRGQAADDPSARRPSAPGPRPEVVREEYVSEEIVPDLGLRSVIRLELVLRADAPVSGRVAKGSGEESFELEAGEVRRFVDPDHFELWLSDPTAVKVVLNGVEQEPPAHLGNAPWFLSLQSLR